MAKLQKSTENKERGKRVLCTIFVLLLRVKRGGLYQPAPQKNFLKWKNHSLSAAYEQKTLLA